MNKKIIYIALGIIAVVILAALLFIGESKNQKNKEEENRTVYLYYYSLVKDKDDAGNPQCSEKALGSVARTLPKTDTLIEDTINLFLKGELTGADRENGLTTEYPLPGVVLSGAGLRDGILTLDISDPQHATSGGACRATLLKAQLEATAKQFEGVEEVRYVNPELFQP